MSDGNGKHVEMGVAGASAMAAAAVGAVNPVAATFAAGIAGLLPYLVERFYERRALAEGVEESSDLPLEEALERLADTPEGVVLLQEVLEQVASSTFDEKLRTLGECVGNAAAADDVVIAAVSERTWVRLIGQLDRPHIEAIAALIDTPWVPHDETEYYQTCELTFHKTLKPYDQLTRNTVLVELQALGLVRKYEQVQVAGKRTPLVPLTGPFWRPTQRARQVLERLREHTTASEPADQSVPE